MKLILPDHDERIIEHCTATVEQILLEAGINPLDVLVSRNGNLILRTRSSGMRMRSGLSG